MNMNNKEITIKNDIELMSDDIIKIHFMYNNELSLKELSELLDLTNKAIHDFNRDNGAGNKNIETTYPTKVKSVENGSVILNILINIVSPIMIGVLSNYIYDRIIMLGKKKKSTDNPGNNKNPKYPIYISVYGNENKIDININN